MSLSARRVAKWRTKEGEEPARAHDPGKFIVEELDLAYESDSDTEYPEVPVPPVEFADPAPRVVLEPGAPDPRVIQFNETPDDFVRNWLTAHGYKETLGEFQREWYEVHKEPPQCRDLTAEIDHLRRQIKEAEGERRKWQQVVAEVQQTWDRLRAERDFHSEGLRRVEEERQVLHGDLRKITKTVKRMGPAEEELRLRWEQVNKERSLLRMEKERLQERIAQLQGMAAHESGEPKD